MLVVTCPSDCPDTPQITLQNVNITGVGVLDNWDGTTGDFRGVASGNAMATVTLDAGNNLALITLSATEIANAFRAATEAQTGILEVATQTETNAGTADDKIITPLKLATRAASTTMTGLIELATQAEVNTGTDATLAVAPSTLATNLAGKAYLSLANGAINNIVNNSSTTNFPGANIIFDGGGSGLIIFQNSIFEVGSGTVLNFSSSSSLGLDLATIISSVLVTDASGSLAPVPITGFISSQNLQTGWTAPSGTIARTTFATYTAAAISNPPTQAEVQAIANAVQNVSRGFGALVNDLMAIKLPAT